MHEKIVLIGAGSAMFTRGLVADLIRTGWECELSLIDTDPAALAIAEGLTAKMIQARIAPIRLSADTDRRQVLDGATVVICTIGVGGRRSWELDVVIPRKFGIYQPVGDTIMPGGSSRALRMIPPMVAIARDVQQLAPSALFFNYGNPMAAVCRAVEKATGAGMIGLCHGVNHVGQYLAARLGAEPSQLTYTAVGMNHLTWFTEIRVAGQDVLPRLHQVAREMLAAAEPRDNPFSWELLELFGAFPAVLDRHVTEFFPQLFAGGKYFGRTLGVDVFSVEETIYWGDRIFDDMRAIATSHDALPGDYFGRIGGEHEQVIDIIDSVRRDARRIYSANLPNRGQAPNLPPEAVVESPVIADASGLRPIALPPLPAGIAGTLTRPLAWVEAIVDAALHASRDEFIQALVLDGSAGMLQTTAQLADELLAAHAKHLPGFACTPGLRPPLV